jgi:xanthine/uracil permease
MFKSLLGGNPFINKNVSCFRRMAVACAVISLLYIIKCFFLFTIATVIIVLVFVIGCLFCLTLKDIFKQAIALKEENDLTV